MKHHKDVAVVSNADMSKGTIPGTGNIGGCDGDFRYWEKRDDFSVANKSTVLISYDVRPLSWWQRCFCLA